MKAKKEFWHRETLYDSQEEIEFVLWLEEASKNGFIKEWEYHPATWEIIPKVTYPVTKQLKTKTKIVDKFLLHPLTYEPDFRVVFNDDFSSTFGGGLLIDIARTSSGFCDSPNIWIDVKGIFNQQDAHRRFSVIQKVIFYRIGLFVNMVIPQKFFKKTWVPEQCAWMKNRIEPTRRKAYADCKLLKELI